jgi:hypothetical protein
MESLVNGRNPKSSNAGYPFSHFAAASGLVVMAGLDPATHAP